jgi:eukaryotic-like serine/threonine-protein kinase
MPTDFHLRVLQILETIARVPPTEREAAIRRACGADSQLQHEVLSMLPHYLALREYEPDPPHGLGWQFPSTTSFAKAKAEADAAEIVDSEPQPPFNIDQYTTIQIVGRGGMGVVYRAVHMTLRRVVAIKLLRSRFHSARDLKRFNFEVEILRQLRHPAIARFSYSGMTRLRTGNLETGPPEERPYFVMEFVAGDPLTGFAVVRQLTARQRLGLLARVCEAVEYAHSRGVVHCDLKPDNILVQRSGQPKILDFGIARLAALDTGYTGSDLSGAAGTLPYACPEQLRGRVDDLTPGSDVYTLGLIAHELLTGRLPQRDADGVHLTLRSVQIDDDLPLLHPRNAQFQRGLERIIGRAVRQLPDAPYRNAGELRADIQSLLLRFPARSRWGVFVSRVGRRVLALISRRARAADRA